MAFKELVISSRSCRRFREDEKISREILEELVDLARLSPSGGNRQPLKFYLENSPGGNSKIFPHLAWAGYLSDWDGPEEGERPAAYIIILQDTRIRENPGCDHGIAAQSILLGAAEQGFRGCMIGSVKRERLSEDLGLDGRYRIMLVVALGFPAEEAVLEEMPENGSIKYWRGEDGRHHVPKRALEEIIIH
ncbi:MAG: nitroreductase [Candidatus Latescibacteria bacterium]|nr:nitroreductase [bacterium]MBD3425336.1 nitroreductase [Candidatus Latescibacterota bacterium]